MSKSLLAAFSLFYWFIPILAGIVLVMIPILPSVVIYRLKTTHQLMQTLVDEALLINLLYWLVEGIAVILVIFYALIFDKPLQLIPNLMGLLAVIVYDLHIFVFIFAVITLKNLMTSRLKLILTLFAGLAISDILYFGQHWSYGLFMLSDRVILDRINMVALFINVLTAILCFLIVEVVGEWCLNQKDFLIRKI
ncbi:hypothetical protein LCO01nite_09340 [Lapidilactobacillus concavus]|uniref:hypothetical protein n=1 Tax=Lapidilactobacillus concavus TaxID=287844 RepID=UPI00070E8764|nr:hypothetical protein [Lapidilactobacillus concavus]GEL13385.1 hypothetical protein LCO01nite_09340 [Lapidilactobacillus concavus]